MMVYFSIEIYRGEGSLAKFGRSDGLVRFANVPDS